MENTHAERHKSVQVRPMTATDWNILDSYKTILHGLILLNGPNCVAALHSAENRNYPCIAVENGQIDDIAIGSPLSSKYAEALKTEAYYSGKDTIGLNYIRTKDEHPLKCVINVIRNKNRDIIGALCVSLDLSVSLYQFMRDYIPELDNNVSIDSSKTTTPIQTVDDMIKRAIEQAIINVNKKRGISSADRNRIITKQLNDNGIFNIRGAVDAVAKELGVSRYSIYNYIKDNIPDSEE